MLREVSYKELTLKCTPRTESDGYSFSSNTVDDGLNDIKRKSRTILDGTSILVCSVIDYILNELIDKIAIRT